MSRQTIEKLYTAFQNGDGDAMAACYHPEATFSDPAFQNLKGDEPGDMWRMLLERSNGNLKIEYSVLSADAEKGEAKWEAWYPFSQTGRKVHNKIHARFRFKDGLIIEHRDHFNFWRWSRQALGAPGMFLGWTPFLKKKVGGIAMSGLRKWRAANGR